MPASIIVPLFIFLPFLLLAFWGAANVKRIERSSARLEERIELLGQRVGEAVIGFIWNLMKLNSEGEQQRIGSYYADITFGRHEALSALDGTVATDQRVLFLHEVEMSTKLNFISITGHTVCVSRKHARRIEEFILFNPLYGDNASKVFMQHGYVLEIA